MTGLGAWSFGPYHRGMDVPDDRVAAGILVFKKELTRNGYGHGLKLDLPVFGNMAEARTKDFQGYAGITVDGVIWSHTARALFRKLSNDHQKSRGIPHSWLARIKTLESNNDPVAQGYVDEQDEGLMQLHLPYWPGWTREMAWDPDQAVPAAADKFIEAKNYTGDWRGAVAAHNIGWVYAKQWVEAGFPATGGPIMGVDPHGNPIYAFTRATNYLRLVESAKL